MAIGRISGPLLKANLVRDGVDLAFETDLLYLNVTDYRVGINTSSPDTDLHVNGTIKTTTFRVDDQLTVADLNFFDNNITSDTGIIDFTASSGLATVYHSRLSVDDLEIQGNRIATVNSNSNLELEASGAGTIELLSTTNVTGDLNVTGNISAVGNIVVGGNVILGDETSDSISVNAQIDSDLIPKLDNTYDIGSSLLGWKSLYANEIYATSSASIANLTFSSNTINSADNLIFSTADNGSIIFNSKVTIDDIDIQANTISTNVSNSSLELIPNGSGTIELQAATNITGDLNVTGDVDVTGNVTIGGDIIIGDELTDTITINASITSDLIPELDNTYDLGSPTYSWRTAYVNNFFATSFSVSTLTVGDITFSDNQISTVSGQDLLLDGNGTGGVQLANFLIAGNVITNVVSDAISVIAQTGTGYFKIDTTNGFVPPVGGNAQRPLGYAVEGMTRYNSDSKSLEIYDGSNWVSPAGTSGSVTEATANDIAAAYAIALG